MSLAALLGLLAGIIHLPVTQNYLARRVMASLEKNLHTEFSVSSLRFGLFRPLTARDFLIRDRQQDTLIYARDVTLWPDLHLTSLKDKGFVISKAVVKGAFVRLIVPADTASNFEFLFGGKNNAAGNPFYLSLKEADMTDSRFVLQVQGVEYKPFGVHFTDVDLHHIRGKVKNLEIFNKVLSLSARDVSFTDATGWQVNELSADMENSPRHLWFDNIRIVTPYSNLVADYYHMDFRSTDDYKDFPNKVHLSGVLRPSLLGYRDFCAIAQTPRLLHNDIHFSGKAHGVLSNLVITGLKVQLEKNTSLEGNVNLVGLPDFRETYLHINVRKLVSDMDDIAELYQPGTDKKLRIPGNFMKLGRITYNGRFTGFLNDFVSYGTLTTDLGSLEDDISISVDSGNVRFKGYLASLGFDIGRFSGNEKILGRVTMHANMHGRVYPNNTFTSFLTGTIDSMEVNHYTYHSIALDGRFSDKAYDGSIKVDDPHLQLAFLGMFDFTGRLPEFDFSLNVLNASLAPLNISPADTHLVFTGLVLANFQGSNLEDFSGNIKLLDAQLQRQKEKLNIYNVQMQAFNSPDSGSLQLRSDYLNATLQGRYNFQELVPSLRYLLAGYFPGTFSGRDRQPPKDNDFAFRLRFINIDPFTEFFTPGYSLAHEARITGRYAPAIRLLQMDAATDWLITPDISVDTLQVNISTNDLLSAHVEGAYLDLSSGITTEHFTSNFMAARDTVNAYLSWDTNKPDSLGGRDHLHLLTYVKKPGEKDPLHAVITIDSTSLILGPRRWVLQPSRISIDSTTIHVFHFGATSNEKSLYVSGKLSEDPADTLHTVFRNLDISYLTNRNAKNNLHLEGIINGNISLSNIYHNPIFLSTIGIRDFSLNGEPLGDAVIHSAWDTLTNSLSVDVHTQYGTRRPISISGSYTPARKTLKADLLFDKFRLKAFSSFVSAVFSSLNGNVTGNLHMEGDLLAPAINGDLNFQKTSLTVDYLKTAYTFSSHVPVRDNHFLMDSIRVYDPLGNYGIASGYFSLEKILAPAIDMTVKTKNILVLNTSASDNEYFYGHGMASGAVAIKGPLSNISMNISARTRENTSIVLPLAESKGESIETDFVHFVNPHARKKQTGRPERKKKKKKTTQSTMNLNLDLNVTPDAEVTLLFDPAAGGTLYGRGHGNLRMEVQQNGDFSLFGEYIIDEGTYRFTLQKVINKKFRLENGGKITWTGDPLNAHLDILAIYPLKTSLYPLFYDDNYKKRVPVECQILLKGSLNNPKIGFNIDLPTVDEDTRAKVHNAMSSEEELSKQFLSLLIINSFYPNAVYGQQASFGGASVLGVTTTEVLSNQLSSWLSQISKDFDVGFSYHPGDEVTSEQVEVALSTQLLNDQVAIRGNIDFNTQNSTSTTNNSNIVGDFQIDVKLTKNGKLRVKAFTRANDNYLYETAPYTNGVGIFYREEFSSWDKLFKGYWQKLFGKKEEEGNTDRKEKKK